MRRNIFCVGLAALLALILLPPNISAQGEEGEEGNGFKNLMIFPKDIPKEQLKGIMKSFTQQLGVKCVFCHVPDEYHKDEKEHKQVARAMIRMMQSLRDNAETFFPEERNKKLRCWTCHRGTTEIEEFVPEDDG